MRTIHFYCFIISPGQYLSVKQTMAPGLLAYTSYYCKEGCLLETAFYNYVVILLCWMQSFILRVFYVIGKS